MKLYDNHTHTTYSPDGAQSTADLAKSLGFGYNVVYRNRKPIHLPL